MCSIPTFEYCCKTLKYKHIQFYILTACSHHLSKQGYIIYRLLYQEKKINIIYRDDIGKWEKEALLPGSLTCEMNTVKMIALLLC